MFPPTQHVAACGAQLNLTEVYLQNPIPYSLKLVWTILTRFLAGLVLI